jgi:hypothetical protein
MTTYNYFEAVTADVIRYIEDWVILADWEDDREGLEEFLNDELWIEDSVTGNGSGSYTFSRWQAEEYLAHNWAELAEALEEFGQSDINPVDKGAEWCDVTLRCFHLGSAIAAALDKLGVAR